MFLKTPKASTDPRVRSLLQKAARRGFTQVASRTAQRLEKVGDTTWLRSRAVVITFEECWPLAEHLIINRDPESKRNAVLDVARAVKQKDAAGLGALAHAYGEGDHSMACDVPDERMIRIVVAALKRPPAFFEWAHSQCRDERSRNVVTAAQRYLPAATWAWDKATIVAGALLAITQELPTVRSADVTTKAFDFWVALDKHTPQGKIALKKIVPEAKHSYRELIWASFYCESAAVNELLPSPWWEAEKVWRLKRVGLTVESATEIWLCVRDRVRDMLLNETATLESLVGADESVPDHPQKQDTLFGS